MSLEGREARLRGLEVLSLKGSDLSGLSVEYLG